MRSIAANAAAGRGPVPLAPDRDGKTCQMGPRAREFVASLTRILGVLEQSC